MSAEIQERRKRQRGDDILTRIEDVTYAILRNRPPDMDMPEEVLAAAVSAQ